MEKKTDLVKHSAKGYQHNAKHPPRGHRIDEALLSMLHPAASREDPENGFVSALRHDDGSKEIDRIVIYAWGESARHLAAQLEIQPDGDFEIHVPKDAETRTARREKTKRPAPADQTARVENILEAVMDEEDKPRKLLP